ncbi:MAG: UDP-N-acetylmuramoyl-L-alanyl-D-glutamate--2,6-diaminopimelate ligase [Christensenellaceae bacterium]
MKLSRLIEGLTPVRIVGNADIEVTGLSIDSSCVKEGDLFFCIDGERYDSHSFAKEATAAGATAFVAERPVRTDRTQIIVKNSRSAMSHIASRFYGEPSKRLKMIGITGTNGKTTTLRMLASILREHGESVGTIGTLGVEYAGKTTDFGMTTPDPIELHRTLADMDAAGVGTVVMEVSAHALYYAKVFGIKFAACIFTNCTQDHLDFFGTMGRYVAAKQRLFRPESCALAILNYDSEAGRKFARDDVPSVSYALSNPADVFAVNIEESLFGVRFVLNLFDELYEIDLSLTGRHNVENAMAAAACAYRLGVPIGTVARGLEAVKKVEGRLERVASYRGAEIFVDFAHTPDGLEKSLGALSPHAQGRLICLFGCGGNRDEGKREIMGEIAGQNADFVVLTSDNPRYEDPYDIIMAIETGVRRYTDQYVTVQDRQKATEYAIRLLEKGDILLIAGKGGETTKEVMGVRYPYDDKKVVLEILASLSAP